MHYRGSSPGAQEHVNKEANQLSESSVKARQPKFVPQPSWIGWWKPYWPKRCNKWQIWQKYLCYYFQGGATFLDHTRIQEP